MKLKYAKIPQSQKRKKIFFYVNLSYFLTRKYDQNIGFFEIFWNGTSVVKIKINTYLYLVHLQFFEPPSIYTLSNISPHICHPFVCSSVGQLYKDDEVWIPCVRFNVFRWCFGPSECVRSRRQHQEFVDDRISIHNRTSTICCGIQVSWLPFTKRSHLRVLDF